MAVFDPRLRSFLLNEQEQQVVLPHTAGRGGGLLLSVGETASYFCVFSPLAHSRFVETTPSALRGRASSERIRRFHPRPDETAAPRPRRDTGRYLRPRRLRTRHTHTHSYDDEVPRAHRTSQHFCKQP
uniref:Uncharacterized protein n=1 Tax=Rhipicephalus appendiculatus TaxID=34631 RepID=A0A131YHG6_RHIAP